MPLFDKQVNPDDIYFRYYKEDSFLNRNIHIIIIHGLLGSSRNWNSFAQKLTPYHHIYTIDICNHGKSHWIDSMTYNHMSDHLYFWIKKQGLDKKRLVIIGHSMGGKVLMDFFYRYFEEIPFIPIVLDIAPVEYCPREHERDIAYLERVDIKKVESRKEADDELKTFIPDDIKRGFLLHNLSLKINKEDQSKSYSFQCNLKGIFNSLKEITSFPSIWNKKKKEEKIYFIAGKQSPYIGIIDEKLIYEHFPIAKIIHIENSGHNLHVDQPQLLMDNILSIIDQDYS